LTPLRGIAAVWVVLYHYAVYYLPNVHPDRHTALLNKGYLAVDLFFMLSGFVMTHVYREVFTRRVDPRSYWAFMSARIARLYPLHLAVLALFLLVALASSTARYAVGGPWVVMPLSGVRSVLALVANLFMLQGLHASTLSWNYAAWSISLEFMAYLIFPFVLARIWRAGSRTQALLALAMVAVLAWLAWRTQDSFNQWDGPATFLRCVPEFLLGTLLYRAYQSPLRSTVLGGDAVTLVCLAALLAALHTNGPDLLVVVLFALLLMAVVSNRGRVQAWLNSSPLVWLGEVSYALYLIHGLVQHVTSEVMALGWHMHDRAQLSGNASLGVLALMIAISLVLAALSYRWVEKPAQRYLRGALESRRATVQPRVNGRRIIMDGQEAVPHHSDDSEPKGHAVPIP
jgi:peptidoglycan/LPS O-acetylase OafA/YrhL